MSMLGLEQVVLKVNLTNLLELVLEHLLIVIGLLHIVVVVVVVAAAQLEVLPEDEQHVAVLEVVVVMYYFLAADWGYEEDIVANAAVNTRIYYLNIHHNCDASVYLHNQTHR